MRVRNSILSFALATALIAPLAGAQAHDESKFPDWSGQWLRNYGGNPRYDQSKPLRQQQAPLKPEYQARFEASMKAQDAGGHGLDTAYTCLPQGMPRMMSGVSLMEFVVAPNVTHMLFELLTLAPRRIYTDGRPWPKIEEPTFVGYTIGKWLDTDGDGRFDTLEVETRNIRGPRQYDQTGIPAADDDEAVVKERLYLDKANKDILLNEMTTTDNAFTRPWSVLKKYRRQKDVRWEENNCVESNAYITINKEVYFVSHDGHLMPQKKDQAPPDLRYFPVPK